MVTLHSRRQILTSGGGRAGSGLPRAAATFAAGFVCALLLAWHSAYELPAGGADGMTLPGQTSVTAGSACDCSSGSMRGGAAAASAAHSADAAGSTTTAGVGGAAQPLDLDAVPYVVACVTGAGGAYADLVRNWIAHAQQAGLHFVVAALDEATVALAAAQGVPAQRVAFRVTGDFRSDFKAFREMGRAKVAFALQLLERHPRLPVLFIADADQVWLRSPEGYLAQVPDADWYGSHDCLSHAVEEGQPAKYSARCGQIPNNHGFSAHCGGLYGIRNTPRSRAFLAAWADFLTDPASEDAGDPMRRGVDDQQALNMLMDAGGRHSAAPEHPRMAWTFNRSLLVQPLPNALFSNGHQAFIQRTPARLGVTPVAIHATFQRGGVAGKRSRFREFGYWLVEPPAYFGAPAPGGAPPHRFLSYDSGVRAFVEAQAAARYPGGAMPLLEKQWVGMSYQLAAFRDALAAARMLGRTLVLPKLLCWCDSVEPPTDALRWCSWSASDLEMPFECPLDYMLSVKLLDESGVAYRTAGFLGLPQVPPAVRHGLHPVVIAAERPPAGALPALGHAATVWPGIKQGELLQAVAPYRHSPVLHLRGPVPGFLGGFDSPAAAADFDRLLITILGPADSDNWLANEAHWCCMTWGPADETYRRLPYGRPSPLAAGWQPWQAPRLALPTWCGSVSDAHGNSGFTRLPQHPCAFLTNASMAAIAADPTKYEL